MSDIWEQFYNEEEDPNWLNTFMKPDSPPDQTNPYPVNPEHGTSFPITTPLPPSPSTQQTPVQHQNDLDELYNSNPSSHSAVSGYSAQPPSPMPSLPDLTPSPIDAINPIDSPLFLPRPHSPARGAHITSARSELAECRVSNPKREYDKIQKKYPANRRSEQRIQHGRVNLKISTYVKLDLVTIYVRREPEAARRQHNEHPGHFMKEYEFARLTDVQLWPPVPEQDATGNLIYTYACATNLDSAYLSDDGKEVYKLVKSKGSTYNRFQLLVELRYEGGAKDTLIPYEFVLKSSRTRAQYDRQPASSATGATTSQNTPQVICQYLQAETAKIKKIDCDVIETKNHDIAYYIRVGSSDEERWPKDLEGGDVVAFLVDNKGDTYIDFLTAENSKRARLAGVISRTAFIHGRKELCDPENENADLVCVIGEVQVKIIGPVDAGELIYTSKCDQLPGTAVAESQLVRDGHIPTLLGLATESSSDPNVKLVTCLISIVLGISHKDQRRALEEMERSFEERVVNIQKRWKGIWKKSLAMLLFLIVTGVLCYIFLAPNSPYLIKKCEEGCFAPKGTCKVLKFEYIPHESQESDEIDGIRFKWTQLKKKLNLHFDRHPNGTGFRYYLNKNRCVTGSIRAISSWLDPAPRLPRVNVLAVNPNCTLVYYYSAGDGWVAYGSKHFRVVQCDRARKGNTG